MRERGNRNGERATRRSIGPGPPIDTDDALVCLVSDRLQLYFSLRSVRPSGLASLSVGIHIINIIARHEMMKGLRRPHVAPTYAPPRRRRPTDRLFVGLPFPSAPPLCLVLGLITKGARPHPSVARPRSRHVIHPGRQRGRRKRSGGTEADGQTDGVVCSS